MVRTRVAALLASLACLAGTCGRLATADGPPSSGDTRICVHVFDDRNGDGTQQLPDEVGLGAWPVRVQGGRPAYLSTGEDGLACTSVNPGSVSAQVPAQTGWAPTSRVSLRALAVAGQTADVYAGFRRDEGAAPLPPDGAVGIPSLKPPALPVGRLGRLTVGAAQPAPCRITSLRWTTTVGVVDLAVDPTVALGATLLPALDVVEARFSYEGAGGVPVVVLVTSAGAVVRGEGTTRALHLRAEVPGGGVYEYDWDAGRERGCPAPSNVRFAPPPPPGRSGDVGRVGLPPLEGTVTSLRIVTKGGASDLVVPGALALAPDGAARAEDVAAVHLFSEGEGDRIPLRLILLTTSGAALRVPSHPDEPILSLSLRMALPDGSGYEYAWADGSSRDGLVPLFVRFLPPR